MGFPCCFFVLYINLVYVLNYKFECPKSHILILSKYTFLSNKHILCESLLPRASFSLLSHRQCFSAHLITQCVTSFWFFLTYTFLVWIISFLHIIFFLRQFNHRLTGNALYHIITSNTSSQTPSVNGWYPNNQTKQRLPWSVNVSTLLTLLPPSRQPIPSLASHCLPLAAQRWYWPSPLDTW